MVEKKTFNQINGITKEDLEELAELFALKSVDEEADIHEKTVIEVVEVKEEQEP